MKAQDVRASRHRRQQSCLSLRTLRKWTAEIEGAKQFSHKLQATVSELTGRKLRNVIVKVIREEYAHDFR